MNPRAGILVTGTEVLSGRVTDRNGPWLAARLDELGLDLARIEIVGDRPEDMLAALRCMRDAGMSLIVTSGGLGPTADDLTAEVVAEFCGLAMVLDEALQERIAEILRPLAKRWPNVDLEAVKVGNRKQATIPEGATVLAPVGTAPGLVVAPAGPGEGPTVLVLPGPPRELQPMWAQGVLTAAFKAAIGSAVAYRRGTLLLFGIPESEIAKTLREAPGAGVELERLEITTCLHRGELDVSTRYEPDAQEDYTAFERFVRARHPKELFSDDGRSIDELIANELRSRALRIATAESCTGGMLAGRLTDLPGASAYMQGGLVVYSDSAKIEQAGVDPSVIDRSGAVSGEVARALAAGARSRLHADIGVGVTGIAGPDGGSEAKPVGLVWLSVAGPDGQLTRSVKLPGGRAAVRERTTTVAMHLIRRLLMGEHDEHDAEGAHAQA